MKTLKELRDELGVKRDALDAKQNAIQAETRNATPDENTALDSLLAEIVALKGDITRAEALDAEKQSRALAGAPVNSDVSEKDKKDIRSYSTLKAIRSQIPELRQPLTGIEKEMHQEAVNEARALNQDIKGVGFPASVVHYRDNSVTMTTQPEDGSAVVKKDVVDSLSILEMTRNSLVTAQLGAQYFNNLQGNISFTAMTERPIATWKPEVGALDKSNVKFTSEELAPKRLGTYIIQSLQFLKQTAPSIETAIRKEIAYSLAEGVDVAAIAGTGANNQPTGILNHPDVPAVTGLGTNGGALTRAKLLALETALAARNLKGANYAWLINSFTRGFLKATALGANGDRFIMESNSSLLEYPVVMSNMVPADGTKGSGTALSAAIFGDWSELFIAQWGGVDLLVDPYTLAVNGQVRIITQGFFNVLVHRPEAFAAYKDIITTIA